MSEDKILTPLKTIRAKCIECSSGNLIEVKNCPLTNCALWEYRLGKNPKREGIGNKSPKVPEK